MQYHHYVSLLTGACTTSLLSSNDTLGLAFRFTTGIFEIEPGAAKRDPGAGRRDRGAWSLEAGRCMGLLEAMLVGLSDNGSR